MRRQEWAGPVHTGLYFVQHQQRAVAATKRFRGPQVIAIGQAYASLRLNRLDHERSKLFALEFPVQRFQIIKRDILRMRQQWPEPVSPI